MAEASPKETLDDLIYHHMLRGPASASKVKNADVTSNGDPVRLAWRSNDEAVFLRCRPSKTQS